MRRDLRWGPEVVDRFLPQLPPFRMVDRVHAYEPGARLVASKLIGSNEPVFQGHFPNLALWPGVYTLEGLAQSCNLFLGLEGVVGSYEGGWQALRRDLSALSGQRMQPTREVEERAFGFLARAELKWRRPVYSGDVLSYEVGQPERAMGMVVMAVEATVEGERVANGSLTLSEQGTMPS